MKSGDHEPSGQTEAPAAAAPVAAPAGTQTPVQQALWLQRHAGNRVARQVLSRKPRTLARRVELREPGGKWPSAFARREELVKRLNAQGIGVLFELGPANELVGRLMDPTNATPFERKMLEFIGKSEVLPLLMVTNEARTTEGYTSGQGQTVRFQKRVLVDSFSLGLFDLDDMLRSTDESFQLNMIHILTERLSAKDYETNFPKNQLGASFHGGHEAALEAELTHLRGMFGDQSIEFLGEWDDTSYATGNAFVAKIHHGSGTSRFTYKSKDEGYTIVHELTTSQKGEQAGAVYVIKKGENASKRVPVAEFLAERGKVPASKG